MVLVAAALVGAAGWFAFRVYVPEDRCAVLVRKTGRALPPGQLVATEPGQKGIQRDVLGPGRYFYNPYSWDHELKHLTTIPAGDPSTWEWIHSLSARQRDALRAGTFAFKGEFPQIGVVTRKVGKDPAPGQVVVTKASGIKGILEEVLTPGTYKINPYIYEVKLYPAIVIPAGFVGVVTNLFADRAGASTTKRPPVGDDEPAAAPDEAGEGDKPADLRSHVRPLARPGERGTLRDVLQPGVYFINPKLQKVTLLEIGFNEYSQIKVSESENYRISFPSDTGYLISVGVTVIWGIHPEHAAETINEFGNIDRVLDKVIGPQLRSICRNIGSTYAARDFIQGEKREMFQRALTAELQRICRGKNIEILLALVRQIEVHAPMAGPVGGEVPQDLKRTIQESFIAIESQLTKAKQRAAAAVQARLEEELKKVDIARETVKADSRVMVANILAEAEKQAAQIDAQAALEVATIHEEVAKLAAQRIEILGKANADVEKMKNESEAKGYQMLINAFGSGHAYNLYTFAENFQPESIRLFFAGEGTFWTDLARFEELGAAKLLQPRPDEP
jgi:regulator of protease activity HflC (stomatin/prohibitin superfamily)